MLVLIVLQWASGALHAQTSSSLKDELEEVYVVLSVRQLGNTEVAAVIESNNIYLSVREVFDFLKIKVNATSNNDTLSGYFINPASTYKINALTSEIVYHNKTYKLTPGDFRLSSTNFFLHSSLFNEIFQLECTFNFRSLAVTLNTKHDLPAVREIQQARVRQNISHLKGERKADTMLKRKLPMLSIGVADWLVINSKRNDETSNTRVHLNLGGVVAGGEATAFLNYNSNQKVDWGQQFYRWRYVNNKSPYLKQVMVGNVFMQTTSTLFGLVRGVQISNTPTHFRRSFGTYKYANTTEPGWLVELYVNNVLVNYTKADASGFYTFDVPIVYGNSQIKLRFFSPWGEEQVQEQNITIPFGFLPDKEFEYTLTAGVEDGSEANKISRLSMNYGVNNYITIGGGSEYVSNVNGNKHIPYINAFIRLPSNLLLSAEHSYGVRSRGILRYHLANNMQMEMNYTKYVEGQTAIRSGKIASDFKEELQGMLLMPIRTKAFAAFTRMSYSRIKIANTAFNSAEMLLSGEFDKVSVNLTTTSAFSDPSKALVFSSLSLGFRLPKGIRFIPQIRYEYRNQEMNMIRAEFEKNLFNQGFFNMVYEKNQVQQNQFTMGIRYNFSFARISAFVVKQDRGTSTIQTGNGSLIFNSRAAKLYSSNQSSLGRGGFVLVPFLDYNGNGEKDSDEPKVQGLKVRVSGGRLEHDKKDTLVRITGLEPFTNYFIDIDKGSFDNIGWQIRSTSISASAEANHIRYIEIPVSVVGEVSGEVYLEKDQKLKGLSKIIIGIYDMNDRLVAKTSTESDGYFTYIGLAPGEYTARLEPWQLEQMKLHTDQAHISFTVTRTKDGDIVDGLQFKVRAAR